jgi:aldehyde:ferredoxin oxidoreductase
MTPMEAGPTEGSVPDMDLMLKEFYELRGLNDDGVPKKEILARLGLSDLVQLLHHNRG